MLNLKLEIMTKFGEKKQTTELWVDKKFDPESRQFYYNYKTN